MAQMDFDIVGIILRWMHILAAIALFGGTIFQRLALVPAAVVGTTAATALPQTA